MQLVLVGDNGVGKSCILLRFADDTFTETPISSIGVDFRHSTIQVEAKTCKLQIWDTAGQERYRTITSAYYRGADGIVIVYDVTSVSSFKHVNEWLAEVNRYAAEDCCKLLIGNKIDLDKRAVTAGEGKGYAEELGMAFVETSACTGDGVPQAFSVITEALIKRDAGTQNGAAAGRVSLSARARGKQPGNCC